MGIVYHSEEPATSASTSSGGRGSAGRRSGGIYNSIKKMTRPSTAASASSGCCSDYCYSSLDKVVQALAREGLGQSNLIIGVHFTKCNYGTGDPCERAISIIEKTMAPFGADSLYPCFGFGDEAGKVFSFHSDHSPCDGIKEVLACYDKIVPNVALSGPTSYAPVIEAAVDTVENRGGQFHTLVLVSENKVTRSFFNPRNDKLSPEGTETVKSIANASSYPLSIILVGVGYGSWEHMKKFQDKIPKRKFDNFQFVNFSDMYMTRDANSSKKEAAFAFAVLKQIPLQYKTALELGIIGCTTGKAKKTVLCSPPVPHTRHAPPTSEPSNLPLPATEMNERCLQEVTDAFWKGLESSNLIVGIDFTKGNECTGKVSSDSQYLHATNGDTPNPYEKVVTIVGKSFSQFQKDNLIHCFGFGDATTLDHEVFSFHGDHSPCYGFEEVLVCYKRIVRNVQLAGRTSYAPMIEAAVDMVEKSGGQYHVLVIITAGQVTRSSCAGNMSLQEDETIRSIADASSYPIFIILVGVGGGPWEDLKKLFAEKIPACGNFKFVNFSDNMPMPATTSQKEAAFPFDALMEASVHYQSSVHSGIVGRTTGKANKVTPRPPPFPSTNRATPGTSKPRDHSAPSVNYQRQMECPVCLVNEKDMAFGCGHVVCEGCGTRLSNCPLCRKSIHIRIRLYNV